MWENLQKVKRKSCTAKTINIPAPNAKTKKTDKNRLSILKQLVMLIV
jgi:hypothetical protein